MPGARAEIQRADGALLVEQACGRSGLSNIGNRRCTAGEAERTRPQRLGGFGFCLKGGRHLSSR
jgi:hypothetical protein